MAKEYIDREALKKNFESRYMDYRNRSEKKLGNGYRAVDDTLQTAAIIMKSCLNTVCETPAADVAEVRHGKWISYKTDEPYGPYDTKAWYKCSECGKDAIGRCDQDEYYSCPNLSDYCPFCGAKMDGEDGAENG